MKVEVIATAYINEEEYKLGTEIDTNNEEESMKKLRLLFNNCKRTAHKND